MLDHQIDAQGLRPNVGIILLNKYLVHKKRNDALQQELI